MGLRMRVSQVFVDNWGGEKGVKNTQSGAIIKGISWRRGDKSFDTI